MITESFVYFLATIGVFSLLILGLKNKLKKAIDNGIKEVEEQIINSKKQKLQALNIFEKLNEEKNRLISEESIEIAKYKEEINHKMEKERELFFEKMEKELENAKDKISKLKESKLNEFKSFMTGVFIDTTKENYKKANESFTISSIDGIEKVFIDKTKE